MPVGFGYIDIVKNPQMYVDKLDQIISRNALQSGKKRFIVKESGNINEEELLDWSQDVIHSKGDVNDVNYREVQTAPLHPFIVEHRREKIDELKEISGANDFSRGQAGNGVTSGSAIMALQEAGNKLSRDMIKGSYNAFKQEVYMIVELIRQFYTEDRNFRIKGQEGKPEYIKYNNQNMQPEQIEPMYQGEKPKYRNPVFDITVKPQRQSPFSTLAHNELAKELFGAGFFNPDMSIPSLVAIEMMTFEGKDAIMEKIKANGIERQQQQQLEQAYQQQQQQIAQMSAIIQKLTGEDMGVGKIG